MSVKTGLGVEDVIGDKREAILEIAARHKAHHVRIFGSVARGEAREDSDVDLLVEFEPNYRLLDHAGLVTELQSLLGRKVEVANAATLRDEYRPYIMKDTFAL
jgi:predicted nucleotidyltransferase